MTTLQVPPNIATSPQDNGSLRFEKAKTTNTQENIMATKPVVCGNCGADIGNSCYLGFCSVCGPDMGMYWKDGTEVYSRKSYGLRRFVYRLIGIRKWVRDNVVRD